MCGICGILRFDHRTPARDASATVQEMLFRMRHRGPNGASVMRGEWGALGANRLAIRSIHDPHPPMVADPTGVLMACNGEIDNHRQLRSQLSIRGHHFHRATDVEVVVPLYLEHGLDFVRHLQGAFAIALWDPRQQRLILARDRAGERYLYFCAQQGEVAFATELGALRAALEHPPKIDERALAGYLGHGFCPAQSGPLAGCQKVAPGELVIIDADGVHRQAYWSLSLGRPPSANRDTQAFDPVFRAAVLRQTDIDVDYGVLLSGGVDSSLITAVARAVRPDRHPTAYGIRFEENSFDEGDVAERVAASLDCAYVPVTVHAQDLPGTLRDLVRTTGEPLADPAWIPMSLVAERASRDVRLVLAGEGADELFGGYPTYMGAQLADRYRALPGTLRRLIRQAVEHLPVSDKKMTISFLLKRFVQGQDLDAHARHLLWTANISPSLMQRLGLEPVPPAAPTTGEHVLDTLQQHDFRHALAEALLAKADRGGMRHSLELRAPFLDPRVIEFACELPPHERVKGLTTKVFLKRYALQYLPRDVVYRRKRGLSVPLTGWLRGPLYAWAKSRLDGPHLGAAGIDHTVALDLLQAHRTRGGDHARALWTLLVLSEWLEWLAEPVVRAPDAALAGITLMNDSSSEGLHV